MFWLLRCGTGFLEGLTGVFKTFSYRPFGSLCSVLNSLAGRLRTVLDCLACFDGSLLDCFASFRNGILILRISG